ncbi:uncharacterized protein [Antedon mediterranea]|uniref:uncharacterized protein isoform X2 n=1 Tax=Antedon mediterranea TaxID=105859 RepID=UPI003AF87BDD
MVAGSAYCAAINCKNKRPKGLGSKIPFYRFPKDTERCAVWVDNCRRKDYRGKSSEYLHRNCRLCAEHFEESQKFKFSNKLVWNAIPTLFDVPNPPRRLPKRRVFVGKVQNDQKLVAKIQNEQKLVAKIQNEQTLVMTRVQNEEMMLVASRVQNEEMLVAGVQNEEDNDIPQNKIKNKRSASIFKDHDYVRKNDKDQTSRNNNPVIILKEVLDKTNKPANTVTIQKLNVDKRNQQSTIVVPIKQVGYVQSTNQKPKLTKDQQIQSLLNEREEMGKEILSHQMERYKMQTLVKRCLASQKTSTRQRVQICRLRKKVKALKDKVSKTIECDNSEEHLIKLARNHISGTTLDFFVSQITGVNKKEGRRYKEGVMSLAMKVYKESPKAYAELCKVFTLPIVSTLKKRARKLLKASQGTAPQKTGGSIDEQVTGGSIDEQISGGSVDAHISGGSVDAQITDGSIDKQVTVPVMFQESATAVEEMVGIIEANPSEQQTVYHNISEAADGSNLPAMVDRMVELSPLVVISLGESLAKDAATELTA